MFRIGSLDGWAKALSASQSVLGWAMMLLYVVIVVAGPCIVANICIAAMTSTFNGALDEVTAEDQAAHKKARRTETGGGKKHGRYLSSKAKPGEHASWICVPGGLGSENKTTGRGGCNKTICANEACDVMCCCGYRGLKIEW